MLAKTEFGTYTLHCHLWQLVSEFSIHNLLEIYRCETCPASKYLSFDPKTQKGRVLIIPDDRS